jgi:transposase
MGRRVTRLELTTAQQAEARRRLLASTDCRERERLQFVLLASSGEHTLAALARAAGRSRSTIQNWLGKFLSGGLAGLLERDTPPGAISPIAQPAILAQLDAGLKAGMWKTAEDVAVWLKREHRIARARKTIYYWLRKISGTAPLAKRVC